MPPSPFAFSLSRHQGKCYYPLPTDEKTVPKDIHLSKAHNRLALETGFHPTSPSPKTLLLHTLPATEAGTDSPYRLPFQWITLKFSGFLLFNERPLTSFPAFMLGGAN